MALPLGSGNVGINEAPFCRGSKGNYDTTPVCGYNADRLVCVCGKRVMSTLWYISLLTPSTTERELHAILVETYTPREKCM